MQLERDEQIKILEVLRYATEALPGRPVSDVLDPSKVYYSRTISALLNQDLTERQITEVRMYLTRIDKLDQAETDAIDRMSFRSAGRGDIEIDETESEKLRRARDLCGDRIREILGLPESYFYAQHR